MCAFHPMPPSVLGGVGCLPLQRWPSAKGLTLTVQKKEKDRCGVCANFCATEAPARAGSESKVMSWKVGLGVSREPAGVDSSTPTKVVTVEPAEKRKQTWEWETLNAHRWFVPRTGRATHLPEGIRHTPRFLALPGQGRFYTLEVVATPCQSNLSAAFFFPNSGGCLRGSGSHFGPSYAIPSLFIIVVLAVVGCDQSSLRNRA